MDIETPTLSAAGLRRYQALRPDAINNVTERFFAEHANIYAQYGQSGRDACREDLGFHLEFLRPVLEFGLIQPMVDYLRWLASVLATRDIPTEHLPQSLDWLAEFFASRMEEPDAMIVEAALRQTRIRCLEADQAMPAIYAMMPEPWPESAGFEDALLTGDRKGAGLLLDRCLDDGRSLVDAEQHVIQPALYSIGLKWQNNQVTVAQEHLATAISQAVMNQGLMRATLPAANGRKVLLACVEGNNHCLGLQMVADAFQLAGWETQYLGGNVPTHALLKQVKHYAPDLLALSVSFAQQLRTVKEIIAGLPQSTDNARPAVIIGGLAINQFNPLAGELGADTWSPNAHAAVAAGAKITLSRFAA